MKWDGKERRMRSEDDIQLDRLLTTIDTKLDNLHDNFNILTTSFKVHCAKDERSFAWINRCLFIGIGALIVLKIFFKV